MKPSLNRTIYVIYDDSITQERVYMLGEVEFAHTRSFDENYDENYRRPLYYEEYNETWFTSLAKAKQRLLKDYKESFPDEQVKIAQLYDDYWIIIGRYENIEDYR